jgi:isopenicillin N synthase-like dioxygenase
MVTNHMQDKTTIPLIDLDTDPGIDQIRKACLSTGCFRISGGGISETVTQQLLTRMAEFFDLADDHPIKRKAHREQNAGANGWTPMLEEPAYEAGTIAWVESFDCVLSREQIDRLPARYRDSIVPAIWPQIPGFREAVRAQWDLLISLALQVYPLISGMLGQKPDFLGRHASSQALNTMRLLNYPRRPDITDEISKGISAHTDFECITLIHQDAPGLEVQTPAGEWIQVQAEPGKWTVLIGDMVERWSNGKYRATPHRVPTTSWSRHSIVMFMAADPGIQIRPLDTFVDSANPPMFKPITQDGLIDTAMARAETNRLAMQPEIEKRRAEINPG